MSKRHVVVHVYHRGPNFGNSMMFPKLVPFRPQGRASGVEHTALTFPQAPTATNLRKPSSH
eukprot:168399-Pyramimonas_sp.AAC.1